MPYQSSIHKAALFAALISACAIAGFGQEKATKPEAAAPPEINKALRDRVTQFYQYHVDINYRAAYEMVAEDTKDFYFAALKHHYVSFQIGAIRYSDDFTKAEVDVNADEEIRRPEFPGTIVPVPATTHWKIENGKWVWYVVPEQTNPTPMGPSNISALKPGDKISPQDLRKIVDPETIAKMANGILRANGIDKSEVTLATDKASSDVVTLHNGQPGTISVALDPGVKIVGFKATLDKTDVPPNENAVVKLTYEPPDKKRPIPAQTTVRLIVQPFNQVINVAVKFAAGAAANQ